MSRSTHTAVDEKLEQLRANGTPHAIATVVRTLSSTAAKPVSYTHLTLPTINWV